MTNAEFSIWLKGFMAACGSNQLTADQLKLIKEELDKVTAAPYVPQYIIPQYVPQYVPYTPVQPYTWPVTLTDITGSASTTGFQVKLNDVVGINSTGTFSS